MNINKEPVALAAAVRAVVMAGVAFGLSWSPEQIVAFMFAVESVLAVVVRQQVTPTAKLTPAMRKRVSEKGHASDAVLVVVAVVLVVLLLLLLAGPLDINTR